MKRIWLALVLLLLLSGCGRSAENAALLDKLGLKKESITKVTLRYEADAGAAVSVTYKPEDRWYEDLLSYFDASIVEADLDLDKYTEDPLTAILHTVSGDKALQFITTESPNEEGSQVYWLWEGKAFLLQNPEADLQYERIPEKTIRCRDPLYSFLLETSGYAFSGEMGTVQGESWALPSPQGKLAWDMPLPSIETLIAESTTIVRAVVEEQAAVVDNRWQRQASLTEAYVKEHSEHMGLFLFGDWNLKVTEVYRGEVSAGDTLTGRTPFATLQEGTTVIETGPIEERTYSLTEKDRAENILGVSQRPLEEGKEYVFFFQELPCEEQSYWVSDWYLGVMEIATDTSAEETLRPLFNLDRALLSDYCIKIDKVRDMAAR